MTVTDIVHMTREQDLNIVELWEKSQEPQENGDYLIPSDLFFSNTIPLPNLGIVLDERNSDVLDGTISRASFFVKDDYEKIQNSNAMTVMNVIVGTENRDYVILAEIAIQEGFDFLLCSHFQAVTKKYIRNFTIEEVQEFGFGSLVSAFLETWYGVQVSMMHPTVREIFTHPKMQKERIEKSERKYNGNKVYRYVRHHYIKTDELNTAIFGKHSINRKALVWYVTGHWREYKKSGKKIFIQPYWKGALRETKQAEPRNREIITKEENK